MSAIVERRYSPSTAAAVTAKLPASASPDGGFVFSGYVFLWNTISEDLGGWKETIRRPAAAKVLASGANAYCVVDHEKKAVNKLADTQSGTLVLTEDDKGLSFIVNAPASTTASDLAKVIRSSGLGVSIAFVKGKDRRTTLPDGTPLREILEFAAIEEISLVVDAAYKSSSVSVVERSPGARQRSTSARPSQTRTAPTVAYLSRQMDQFCLEAGIPLTEKRANPHHDQDGRFHNGTPNNLLAAARGRLAKAERSHVRATEAYQTAEATAADPDGPEVMIAWHDMQDTRRAHQDAIDAARTAVDGVDASFERRMEEHRRLVAASRAKLNQWQMTQAKTT